ncbi:MAG: DUF2185 domain-containing protein [Oscillospiraceae bacterium]|nr:DUF2185 domain-containing protein [Oscillospiraceae bacterium]
MAAIYEKNKDGYIQIEIKPLLDWNGKGPEGCIASDKITKDGWKVGYMYREEPDKGVPDSGWRFLKGDEDDAYMDEPNNHHVFALNTICNYDKDIIPYLDSPIGTYLMRTPDNIFVVDDNTQPIYMEKQ